MNSLTDLLGTGPSMPAQTKMKFQDSHPENFAPQQTVDLPLHNSLSMHGCANASNWKSVLPFSAKEGTLYQQGDLEITIQIQTMKYLVRSLLSFKCTNMLASVADISVDMANKQGLKDAMQIECSPVRYQAGQPPQVIVMTMVKESCLICPTLQVSYTVQGEPRQSGIEIRLPVYVNKAIQSVDNMTEQAFKKNWDDLSFNRPNSFQKLDTILKNPAPPNVPISAVLAQISNFCQ